ncbi:MAG: hypothetical protein KIT40_05020 [Nitrospira sp.]|nr:hypothetical protein [Nitrospira sp.]
MGEQKVPQRGTGPVESLRDEFRRHLDIFYSRLKLAAPYDSVEKALGTLTATLKALPPEELQRLGMDETQRWAHFRQAFIDSGLIQKHRGIIAGLTRSSAPLDLPPEFNHLLDLYRAKG